MVDFKYNVERSSDLATWTVIDADIVGQANSTTRTINDPDLSANVGNFYRVVLKGTY